MPSRLIPDFDDDIVINYSHADNAFLDENNKGWVDALYERLKSRLRQLTGVDPEIYLDKRKMSGPDYGTDSLVIKLHRVALLVAILSPSYLTSDWCIKELEWFYEQAAKTGGVQIKNKSRIFKVIKTPIAREKHPQALKDAPGYEFYETDNSGKPREFSHNIQFETFGKFIQKVEELAWDIKTFVELMQKDSANPPEQEAIRALRVFLCHSSGDKPAVRSLYQRLHADSFDPWLDEENILPGEEWDEKIQEAVRSSDIVIVCLSHNSINRSGYLQKEIRFALDIADQQPPGTIFLIPVKLMECDVPERFSRWHWVNLFEDEEKGYERLIRALNVRASKLRTATDRAI